MIPVVLPYNHWVQPAGALLTSRHEIWVIWKVKRNLLKQGEKLRVLYFRGQLVTFFPYFVARLFQLQFKRTFDWTCHTMAKLSLLLGFSRQYVGVFNTAAWLFTRLENIPSTQTAANMKTLFLIMSSLGDWFGLQCWRCWQNLLRSRKSLMAIKIWGKTVCQYRKSN